MAVSAAVHDPQELHNAFTGNFELIKYRLYADDYILFNTADYAFSDRIDVADYEAAFFSAISSQSYTKASQALSDIIRYIKENRPHPDIVLAYFSLLNIRLRNIPISYGFSNEELLFRNVYETSISSAFNLEDYYRYFLDYANNIIAGLNIKTTSKNNELIASIQAYIVENIENDISLSSVSEHYGMTPQYLSMLFKQETQQNFVKFLTQAKIDRSKELLANTAWPVKKIAEHIGYNERSFFTVFKKHTGMTPKEYRTDAHNRGGGENLPMNENTVRPARTYKNPIRRPFCGWGFIIYTLLVHCFHDILRLNCHLRPCRDKPPVHVWGFKAMVKCKFPDIFLDSRPVLVFYRSYNIVPIGYQIAGYRLLIIFSGLGAHLCLDNHIFCLQKIRFLTVQIQRGLPHCDPYYIRIGKHLFLRLHRLSIPVFCFHRSGQLPQSAWTFRSAAAAGDWGRNSSPTRPV